MNESLLTTYKEISTTILRPVTKEGNFPILISAPHHVTHFRGTSPKECDDYTGDIAAILTHLLDCHLIVNVSGICDPNYDNEDKSMYKRITSAYIKEHGIKLFIDIHGMSDNHQCDICFGTDNGNSIPDELVSRLDSLPLFQNYTCLLNEPFAAASGDNTMAKFVHKSCKIDSLQIEIAKKYRKIDNNTVGLIDSLQGYIRHLYDVLVSDV